MTELQAIVVGMISGLVYASPMKVDVDIETDKDGNYTGKILITGQVTGDEVLVTVSPFGEYDTPESVAEKMKGVRAIQEAAARHLGDEK